VRPAPASDATAYFWGPRIAGELDEFWPWLPPVSFLAPLIAAILVAVWLVGRAALRPLAAMSHAARRIAGGELEFALPASRVSEVAEVAGAFTAMGDALRQAMYRQADAEQERRLFVSAVAHDLRTPLFALRGYLEALRKGMADSPEKAAHYVAVCEEKADQIERLATDLFSYARLEYLDQIPQRECFDLGELLCQLAEGVQPQADTKGVNLWIDGAREPCLMAADRHLLARAVSNLLDNALRHTPAGCQVTLRWRHAADHAAITVADTGSGIPAEDLPRIFTPLYRGDPSRSRRTGGAGLGLTIAQRVVEAHGGTIVAANRPGGGAEFLVQIPIEDAPPPATIEQAAPDVAFR
jgi:signal transduction histidine kinase